MRDSRENDEKPPVYQFFSQAGVQVVSSGVLSGRGYRRPPDPLIVEKVKITNSGGILGEKHYFFLIPNTNFVFPPQRYIEVEDF